MSLAVAFRIGGAGGGSSRRGPPGGPTTSVCFFRRLGEGSRNGATSAVASSHTSSDPTDTRVITWSNCDGEGKSGSSATAELIRAADTCRPMLSDRLASSVCLSLQSPYWLWSTSPAAWG